MCLKPLKLYNKDTREVTEVPCQKCFGCRLSYANEIAFLADCEKQEAYDRGAGCSFATLTYSDDNLPLTISDDNIPSETLKKAHFRDFMKRFRIYIWRKYKLQNLRFIGCGEYGEISFRPHYHFVTFGVTGSIAEDAILSTWNYGNIQCSDLLPGGIQYVSKYLIKSKLNTFDNLYLYDSMNKEKPFFRRSHYLGLDYVDKHIPKDSCFYNGRLLPRRVRTYLGLTYQDYLHDVKIKAKQHGFDDYKEYEAYNKREFILRNQRILRQQNIPFRYSDFT